MLKSIDKNFGATIQVHVFVHRITPPTFYALFEGFYSQQKIILQTVFNIFNMRVNKSLPLKFYHFMWLLGLAFAKIDKPTPPYLIRAQTF